MATTNTLLRLLRTSADCKQRSFPIREPPFPEAIQSCTGYSASLWSRRNVPSTHMAYTSSPPSTCINYAPPSRHRAVHSSQRFNKQNVLVNIPLSDNRQCISIKPRCAAFHVSAEGKLQTSSSTSPKAHEKNSVVLRQKIPPNFVADTYLPHIEDQIALHAHTLTPAQLAPLVSAYAALPASLRHKTLAKKLSETIKLRISAFRASECVQILYPMYQMLPSDINLFIEMGEHLLSPHIFSQITTLQLIGIVRVYSKLKASTKDVLEKFRPRLQEEIAAHDPIELCDILGSIAAYARRSGNQQDMELLNIVIPEIERKYTETSLLHMISNLNSLTKLKIHHEGLLKRVTMDLSDGLRIRNFPPKYIARTCWVYARHGKLPLIAHSIIPLVQSNINGFSPIDFGKLCQALPEGSPELTKICENMMPKLPEFTRNEFATFFLGCVRRGFFPLEDGSPPYPLESKSPEAETTTPSYPANTLSVQLDRSDLLEKCLAYLRAEDQNFREDECLRLIYLLKHSESYRYLLKEFPASWQEQISEVLELGSSVS